MVLSKLLTLNTSFIVLAKISALPRRASVNLVDPCRGRCRPFMVKLFPSRRVDEGRKGWSLLAIATQGTNRVGEGGEGACSVTLDLSYG